MIQGRGKSSVIPVFFPIFCFPVGTHSFCSCFSGWSCFFGSGRHVTGTVSTAAFVAIRSRHSMTDGFFIMTQGMQQAYFSSNVLKAFNFFYEVRDKWTGSALFASENWFQTWSVCAVPTLSQSSNAQDRYHSEYARSSDMERAFWELGLSGTVGFQELAILFPLSTQPSAEEAVRSTTPRSPVSPWGGKWSTWGRNWSR